MCPSFKTGDKLSFDRRQLFAELKNKGEKIHFRIVGNDYQYDAKHFFQDDNGKWIVTFCPRVMNDLKCEYCEKYFDLKNQARAEEDEKKQKEFLKQARKFGPTIRFYYPIIDREKEMARVFKATLSTRIKFDQEHENGIDIVDYDYIVTRTETPGSDYYSLTRLDSKQTKPLTAKEKIEVEKINGWNLEEIVAGKSSKIVKKRKENS